MPADFDSHFVLLSLDSRTTSDNQLINRVSLKAENISISTNKDVMAMPVPFSGIVSGEATKVALDFGVSTKTISVTGIITEQNIYKKFNSKDADLQNSLLLPYMKGISSPTYEVTVFMTAEEVSQMIHSYVDSSFRQARQNLNEIIVLIKSRVDGNYQYYDGVSATTKIDDTAIKTIPFTYKVRGGAGEFDNEGASTLSTWPNPIEDDTSEIGGVTGFIRSFSTTFVPGQPFVEFSLDFEQAAAGII
jgi:hypothetical protein